MAELKVESCTPFGCKFSYRGGQYETHMGGYHQIKNALTVIEVINALRGEGYDIPEAALKSGLLAQVPARVQILSREPLVILDGGHNPEGVKALANALAALDCPKRAVIGMLGDKDSETAAEQIAQAAESFICVDGYCPRAREKGELADTGTTRCESRTLAILPRGNCTAGDSRAEGRRSACDMRLAIPGRAFRRREDSKQRA